MSDEVTEMCTQTVTSPSGWNHYPCSRKAWKDGFCKQHHPDSVKAREVASEKRYLEKLKKSPWHRLEQANNRIAELEALLKAKE